MPREHRPPPPPSVNGNIYNANPLSSKPNPTAGPYDPRNTLSLTESPVFPNLQDRVPTVDLSITPEKPPTATPKFGETSPLSSKVRSLGSKGPPPPAPRGMSSLLPQEWLIPKPANDKLAWATPVSLNSFAKAAPTSIPMPTDGGVLGGNTGPVSRGFTAVNPTGSPQKFTDYRDMAGHSGGGSGMGGGRRFGGPDEFGLGGYVDPAKTSDRIKALFDGLENDEDVPRVRKKGRKRGRKGGKVRSGDEEEGGKVDKE